MLVLSAAANGNGASVAVPSPGHMYKTHEFGFFVYGTWDSADVHFEVSPDNSNWLDVLKADGTLLSLTANDYVLITVRAPFVRGVVANGLGSESITAVMY
jgi:hypothetical protein